MAAATISNKNTPVQNFDIAYSDFKYTEKELENTQKALNTWTGFVSNDYPGARQAEKAKAIADLMASGYADMQIAMALMHPRDQKSAACGNSDFFSGPCKVPRELYNRGFMKIAVATSLSSGFEISFSSSPFVKE